MKYRRNVGMAVLVAGLVLVSACGKGTTKQATQTAAPNTSSDFTGDPEGPYCRAALSWAVVEMTPRDGSPPVEKKYWEDYAAFLKHGEDVAPAEIKSDYRVYGANGIDVVLPILRKYGFDKKRFESTASASEKKAVENNPPSVDQAFSQILKYEWQVCGNGTPDAATNVKFTGDKDSAYCTSQRESHAAFQKVPDAGFTPEAARAFFTGSTFTNAVAKAESIAPEAIKSDVAANVNWIRTKQLPVLEKYGYDFKRIKLEGTPEERFASDTSAVEIRNVERRLNAYDNQVCGL